MGHGTKRKALYPVHLYPNMQQQLQMQHEGTLEQQHATNRWNLEDQAAQPPSSLPAPLAQAQALSPITSLSAVKSTFSSLRRQPRYTLRFTQLQTFRIIHLRRQEKLYRLL